MAIKTQEKTSRDKLLSARGSTEKKSKDLRKKAHERGASAKVLEGKCNT